MWLFNVTSLGSEIQVNVTFAIGEDSQLFVFKTFEQAFVSLERFQKLFLLCQSQMILL